MKRISVIVALAASLMLAACITPAPATPTPAAAIPTEAAPAVEDAGSPADELSLTAQPWQWIAFSGAQGPFTVETPESYQVTFNEDGTVAIVADCNNAAGSYTDDDGALAITVGPMTMAACPEGSRSDQFVQLLGSAAGYFMVEDQLYINLAADAGVLRLGPAGETADVPDADALAAAEAAQLAAMVAGIKANPWKWTSYSSADENVAVETPASYMVTFNNDGTLDIKADCNDASGTYTLDGMNVAIEVGAATLAACPGDSRSEQFLQLLGDAAQLLPIEGKLYITLKTEGSSMILEAVVTTVADLCGEQALAINTVEDTLAPEISAQLDQILVGLVQQGQHPGPGASMLIITPQGRYFKSTGVADVTTCAPLPADSPFQIGSNTKMMTAAMIFQLQEEGVLSTTDLLSKWLPDLAAALPNGDKITIDMLMTHTSGLHDYFDLPTEDGATIESGAVDNKEMLARAFTPEELVTLVADSGLSYFEPGAEGQWRYSNTGYILLGLIIEQATGKSYEENLQERIFEPLGLEQTYLQTGQPEAGALPQAYYHTPFEYTTGEWNASQGWSAGAVVSTPEEFATFLKALFTGQLFTQPETLDLMLQAPASVVDPLGPGTVYGHGMLDNSGILGHGGQTLGFQSDGGIIPDQDVTIVMWSNAAESNVSRPLVPVIAGLVGGQATTTTTGGNMSSSGKKGSTGDQPAAGQKPKYVTDLETAYGAPSQEAFGSAVFYEQLKAGDDLTEAALAKYKYFVGGLWEKYGEDAWMGPWKEVYARKSGVKPDIVAELQGITDDDASISVPMILDVVKDADKARVALAAAYDDPAVTELRVYNLGDGGAMSGLLVAGRRGETGETTFLVFLYD